MIELNIIAKIFNEHNVEKLNMPHSVTYYEHVFFNIFKPNI